jgi:DNA-binding IclR family transcriptional regulator
LTAETRTSQSVERAFALLDRVAAAGSKGLTLAELAAPVAKSTTHRYVATLLALGALHRDAAGHLRPGTRLVALAGAFLKDDDLRQVAAPLLEDLVALTGETAHLGVPVDSSMVYIEKVESPHSVRLVSQVGARVPMHCSAMGKALLAHLGEAEAAALLAGPLERRTPNTLVGEALREELRLVRERGYAIDDEENEIGVRCVAAPVLADGDEPVGAVSVSGPAARFDRAHCLEFAPRLIEITQEIARRLGLHVAASARDSRNPRQRAASVGAKP